MLTVLLPLLTVMSGPIEAPPETPSEIVEYYRYYNLAMAFSTPGERSRIVGHRQKLQMLRPGKDDRLLPYVMATDPNQVERLARIERWMRRLEKRVREIDPKMAAYVQGPMPEMMYRSDLVEVASVDVDRRKGTALVELRVRTLRPPDNALFVAQYDELAPRESEPTLGRLLAIVPGPNVTTIEHHTWIRDAAGWRREAATRHFLNN
ncbi:MAG TPA: hypothetical protein VFM29_08585 [Vicinamibacteria bacterium]|nr:hypothetical protein [Vicinamibacteria bacterium]